MQYSPRTRWPPLRPWYFSFCHFWAAAVMGSTPFLNQALRQPSATAKAKASPLRGRLLASWTMDPSARRRQPEKR